MPPSRFSLEVGLKRGEGGGVTAGQYHTCTICPLTHTSSGLEYTLHHTHIHACVHACDLRISPTVLAEKGREA